MTPPTFPELLEGATPGRRDWFCHATGAPFALTTNMGQTDILLATDDDEGKVLIEAKEADLDYISRLDPATMKLVWEALNKVEAIEGVQHATGLDLSHEIAAMRRAITALNTPTAANKEKS